MADRCLGLPGGFGGWLIQWNHAKCCGTDPCCHGNENEIWARRGDSVAYWLVLFVVYVLSAFKSSLQLDALSHITPEPQKIPQPLVEKCAAISVRPNAIKDLIDAMQCMYEVVTYFC